MNIIYVKYVLDSGNVVERRILDSHKLHCINLNFLVLDEAPVDTDYIKRIDVEINVKEEENNG